MKKIQEKISYKKLPKNFSAKKLKNFCDQVLPGKTFQQCQKMIKYSSVFIGAFNKNTLIGIGRALDDTVYAFITDIIVNPKYRKKGIGTKIVKTLCDQLIKKNVKMIHCSTSKKLVPFFKSAAKFNYNSNDITLYLKNF